ncbi:MAG: PspC domain-containing protein [Chloroflexi bacterium]|nr:PspC domain-containing protein [Chloroflexota bacterium]
MEKETMHQEPVTPKRLYRSRQDRMLGGVAGGLGQYFNVDPVLIRLAFVLFTLAGAGVLAYVILWIVVPERPAGEPEPVVTGTLNTERGRQVAGYVLLALGIMVLAANLGWFDSWYWKGLWPLALVIVGIFLLWERGGLPTHRH